jgi:NADPH:quinone reductase-like Zn-dependent oxidoreductase
MSKRIQYHQYGGPEVMRLEDFDPGRPGPGQVLVRVRAASTNPMDAEIRRGSLKMMTGRNFPRGLGHDFAGVVEAVGEGVTRFRVGDEVLGGADPKASGAFAELVVADQEAVVDKPAALSFEAAATLPVAAVTAYQALLKKGRLKPGESVFVTGCLGAVGRTAVQIARAHGVSVSGSCRSTAMAEARQLGVAPIVDFDFDPAKLAGRFDLVLIAGGALSAKAARTMLKRGGRIVDIKPTPAKFVRSALPGPFQVMIAKVDREDLAEVARAAGAGTIQLAVNRTVPLAEAIPALTELEQRRTPSGGKLIITT